MELASERIQKIMKIALDISPLEKGNEHRTRGSGFYLKYLKSSLQQYASNEEFIYFTRREKIPRDVDIIHLPYFEPFFLTLPSKFDQKTIVTVHDLTPIKFKDNFPVGIKGNIKWQLQKSRLKKADFIITDSYSSKKDIVEIIKISEKKVKVIYLAAGEGFTKVCTEDIQALRKKFALPPKFVLYVGDVTWNKNLPRLVKAMTKLKLPLVLVGKALSDKNFDRTNPWNKDLLEVHKLIEKADNIVTLGFVNNIDLVALYSAATVFAMPSLYEGFGLPVIEALQCGTPVITSGEGSLSEVTGDAAVIADAYSMLDIADKIQKVFLDLALQADLSEKGIERAKKFTWEKTARQTLAVYREAVL